MNETFISFLNELAQTLGFSTLTPDQKGVCQLAFEKESLELLFEFDEQLVPNTILLTAFLCPLPEKNKVQVMENCLKENANLLETLSCKPDEELVYLHLRIHPEIRSSELNPLVKNFLADATRLRQKIKQLGEEEAAHRLPMPPPTFEIPRFKA